MKTRIVPIIIALLGIAMGAQAASTYSFRVYDMKRINDTEAYALAALVIEGALSQEQSSSGTVSAYKKVGSTEVLFNVHQSGNITYCTVPYGRIPEKISRTLTDSKPLFNNAYTAVEMSFEVGIDSNNFPNETFRSFVSSNYDTNHDNKLSYDEIVDVKSMNVSGKSIGYLQGLLCFSNLETLNCSNNQLSFLDLSKNKKLKSLLCHGNNFSTAAMDNLISSLPTTSGATLYVKDSSSPADQFTSQQVVAARKKGWMPKYLYNGEWYAIPGPDDISINSANFPDGNFRTWLLSQNYGKDGILTKEETAAVTSISVYSKNIASLKGIEYFTALKALSCDGNQLKTLDLSKNTALTTLVCSGNQLKTLDLSKNTALTTLHCLNNQLTSLNVSSHAALTYLDCSNNQIETLDVTGCKALTVLYCYSNQIQGTAMTAFVNSLPTVTSGNLYVYNNGTEGNEISTAQVQVAKDKHWNVLTSGGSNYAGIATGIVIDETNFPDGNFRNRLLAQSYGSDGILTKEEIAAVTSLSIYGWGIASLKGIEYFTALKKLDCESNELTDLDLSANTALEELHCGANPDMKTLDVSKNTKLKTLGCYSCQLTSLNVSNCPALTSLHCNNNKLEILDARKNTALKELYCEQNKLVSLLVSVNHESLKKLSCYGNSLRGSGLTSLINSMPNVTTEDGYFCVYNNLSNDNTITTTQVEAAKAKGWRVTTANGNDYAGVNGITVNATNFPDPNFRSWVKEKAGKDGILTDDEAAAVKEPYLHNKNIASLKGIEYFTAITILYCYGNQLTELDVSCNLELQSLYCENNQLTSLDLSKNTKLKTLECYGNRIRGKGMTTLVNSLRDISYEEGKGTLKICNNELSYGNDITTIQVNTAKNKYWRVLANDGSGWQDYAGVSPGIAIDETKFPDKNFRDWILSQDFGDDGYLSPDEIAEVNSIYVPNSDIADLTGIKYFTSLRALACQNNRLTELDMSGLTNLRTVYFYGNNLSSQNITRFIESLPSYDEEYGILIAIESNSSTEIAMTTSQVQAASDKGWATLDFWFFSYSGAEAIAIDEENFPCEWFRTDVRLAYDTNQDGYLSTAEAEAVTVYMRGGVTNFKGIEYFTELEQLDAGESSATEIDLSKNTKLKWLSLQDGQLKKLDLSKNTALESVDCWNNQLEEINVSGCSELYYMRCYGNRLTSLDLSNNPNMAYLECYDNQIDGSALSMPTFNAIESGEEGWLVFSSGASDGNMLTKLQAFRLKNKGWYVLTQNDDSSYDEYSGVGGDANGDDTIDKQDVETLRDYILGSLSSSPVNADVDGNNKVDIVDLTKLIEYLTK